jgi:hypothetical protein
MAASSSEGRKAVDVEMLLRRLNLSEVEKEGVFLAKEDRGDLPEVKWMAVGKVLTRKAFSEESLRRTMFAAWNNAREVTFRAIEKNLFLIQAHCLGDWKRIKEEGPWLFRDCALMLEDFDGSSTVPPVIPNRVQAWIQIHKIPPLYRTEAILKQLASRVGEVVKVELKVVSFGNGEFHRARVLLDAGKPLLRFVSLSPEGCPSLFMQVLFEKLPKFCDYCGLMEHVALECGTGEFTEAQLQFGDWMLASMETWHPETPRVRGGFNRDREAHVSGRGAMGGRGGRSGSRQAGGRGRAGGAFGGGMEGVWKEKAPGEGRNAGT